MPACPILGARRNLFQSTEVAYQEAATLYETSRVLANAATPEDIVSAVVNQMRQPHITQAFMAVPVVERDGQIEAMQVVANWQKDDNSINLLGVAVSYMVMEKKRLKRVTQPGWMPAAIAGGFYQP